MKPRSPIRLDVIYATWCPHCVPTSMEPARRLARRLKIPLRLLDIDVPEQEQQADRLVEAHGDWTEDYLIPQVFLEWSDGSVEHLLTGTPGPVAGTLRSWEALFTRAFASSVAKP